MSDIISSNSGLAAEEAPTDAAAEKKEKEQMHNLPAAERKLGIALVGLGTYSEKQLAPALRETTYCHLAGVVSGSAEKRERWRVQHRLKEKNLYSYENFDEIRSNRDIDIVYVVLPNAHHADFVVRAASAGKHVICEKPMATTTEDCRRMIRACRQAGVKLSIGYRLHFEPLNQEMMRLGQNKVFGSLQRIDAEHSMDVGNKNQWRLNQAMAGGGPLMDVGIYCVQAAMYTAGELPSAVTARFHPKTDADKFKDVEEGIEWEMSFPEGLKAFCKCSYNSKGDSLHATALSGWFELHPAYAYTGLKGKTSEGVMAIPSVNQQAAQMDDFALCVQTNTDSRVPGEMGLRDVHILQAIYESARASKTVDLHFAELERSTEI